MTGTSTGRQELVRGFQRSADLADHRCEGAVANMYSRSS